MGLNIATGSVPLWAALVVAVVVCVGYPWATRNADTTSTHWVRQRGAAWALPVQEPGPVGGVAAVHLEFIEQLRRFERLG